MNLWIPRFPRTGGGRSTHSVTPTGCVWLVMCVCVCIFGHYVHKAMYVWLFMFVYVCTHVVGVCECMYVECAWVCMCVRLCVSVRVGVYPWVVAGCGLCIYVHILYTLKPNRGPNLAGPFREVVGLGNKNSPIDRSRKNKAIYIGESWRG